MHAWIARSLYGALLGLGTLTFGQAQPAFANDCAVDPSNGQIPCLPIDRWMGNMPYHNRGLGGPLPDLTAVSNDLQANINQIPLGAGNSGYSLATWVARFSGDGSGTTKAVDGALLMSDAMLGGIVKALENSGVLIGILVLAFALAIWKLRRGGAKAMLQTIAAMLLLFVFLSGAAKTTYTYGTSVADGTGKFGAGSPGWVLTNTNKAIGSTLTTPVDRIKIELQKAPQAVLQSPDAQGNVLHCFNYAQALGSAYRTANGGRSSLVETLSDSWRASGMATWSSVQFGDNRWGAKVDCRLLELANGSLTPQVRATMALHNADGTVVPTPASGWSPTSVAFAAQLRPSTDDAPESDIAMVGWAACRMDSSGTITAEPEWSKLTGSHKVTDKDCQAFFTTDAASAKGSLGMFNYGADPKTWLADVAGSQSVSMFIYSLHGGGQIGGGMQSQLYILAAWITSLIYIPLTAATFVSQVGLVVMGMALFVSTIAALFRNDMDPAIRTGRGALSMMFFTYVAQLLLAIIVMLAGVIQAIGSSLTQSSIIGRPVFTALAPLMAVIVVHLMFKKILKTPSPFTVSGAMAWGSGAARNGAAGALSILGLKELGDWAGSKTRQLSRRAVNKVTSTLPTGSGRTDGMSGKGGGPSTRKGGFESVLRGTKAEKGTPTEDSWTPSWGDPDSAMTLSERAAARESDLKDAKDLSRREDADLYGTGLGGFARKAVTQGGEKLARKVSALGDDRVGAAWFGHAAMNTGQWLARPQNLVKIAGAAVAAPFAVAAAPLAVTAAPVLVAAAGVASARKFRQVQVQRDLERSANGGVTDREAERLRKLVSYNRAQLAEHNQRERAADAAYADAMSKAAGVVRAADGSGWVSTSNGRVLPARATNVTTDPREAIAGNAAARASRGLPLTADEQGRYDATQDLTHGESRARRSW